MLPGKQVVVQRDIGHGRLVKVGNEHTAGVFGIIVTVVRVSPAILQETVTLEVASVMPKFSSPELVVEQWSITML
jgi:hypothetical protein